MQPILWVDVTLQQEEPLHIFPFSDVHLDSRDCDRDGFLADYKRAASFPNARFLNLGDFNNLVMPGDLKRHTASVPAKQYTAEDDYLGIALRDMEKVIASVPEARWDLWGMGNHEHETLKRHHLDLPRLFAEGHGLNVGTYCGRLFYRIRRPGSRDARVFKVLYHHGAWGGAVIKGLGGAQRWAAQLGSWHVMMYGHNHAEQIRKEAFWDADDLGRQSVINRHFLNTGTYQKSLGRAGEPPDYAERAGHPITTIGAPYCRVWYTREGKTKAMRLHWECISKGGVSALDVGEAPPIT